MRNRTRIAIAGLVGLVVGFVFAVAPSHASAQVPPGQVGCYFTQTVAWDGGAVPNQTVIQLDGGQVPVSNYIPTSYCSGVNVVCSLVPSGTTSICVTAQLQESNDNSNWIALPGTSQTVCALYGVGVNIGWVQWNNSAPLVRVDVTTNNQDAGPAGTGSTMYCTASMKGS